MANPVKTLQKVGESVILIPVKILGILVVPFAVFGLLQLALTHPVAFAVLIISAFCWLLYIGRNG